MDEKNLRYLDPGEILGEEEISRLSIIRNSLLRKSITIDGDGVIVYGDVFGERITINLNGVVIIKGNMGAYEVLEVIGRGGLLFINGSVYPGSRISLQDTIVLGGIMGSNIVLDKTIVMGPVITRSKTENENTWYLRAKQSLAASFISLGRLVVGDVVTLLPLLYGGEAVELEGKIYVAGRKGVEELGLLAKQIRSGLDRIKGLSDPLKATETFIKTLEPMNRVASKIVEKIARTSILVLDKDYVSVDKGLLPLFISCLSSYLRESLDESMNALEKLLKNINISMNII